MFDAYTQAAFGDLTAQPVLTDVATALMGLRADPVNPGFGPQTGESYPFFYQSGVAVRLQAHIQGVARLGLPGFENWFVVSKHHHTKKSQAGILLLRWTRVPPGGSLIRLDAPPSGAGEGRVQTSVFNRAVHPGGMQLCGRILAVAQTAANDPPWIDFFDLQNPARPIVLTRLGLRPPQIAEDPPGVTSVALTRNRAGHYLCFAYRYSSDNARRHHGWLFESNTPFVNANTGWQLRAHFDAQSFPAGWREPYESIGFIGQSDGTLFLAGMGGFQTVNYVDLFRCSDNPSALRYVITKPVSTRSGGASFRAGASLFITRPGWLALYTSQMYNAGYGQLTMEEFSA